MRTRIIRQSVTFKASPRELYEMFMDSRKHSEFTGDKATISRGVGGRFVVGEYIQGVNLELIPNEKIIQSWRGSDWPEGHFSRATFSLKAIEGGSRLTLVQRGVPEDHYSEVKKGWHDYYWKPMKKILASAGNQRRG